ncbi:hypothetical protein [Streptomyces sp. NPDC051657]|uniref:PGAP1-like alpha/beta domain-containing protein n=1 Tax=unclassified Streptomyces TaxID=2593676 RepID=UPI003432263A
MHGVGQEYLGRRTLQAPVAASLADGVETAANAGDVPADTVPAVEDVDVAFYGDAFRTPGAKAGPSGSLSVDDVTDPYEQELLLAWADAAARGQAPRTGTKAPTPQVVQRAMNTLLRSPFLPGPVAERFLLGVLRQVRRYFGEDAVRARAIEAVTVRVGPDTAVLVGHSLGSVVAYEALCAHPEWPVRTLVTLGSPLGMPTLVHDRLRPAPPSPAAATAASVWPCWSSSRPRPGTRSSSVCCGPASRSCSTPTGGSPLRDARKASTCPSTTSPSS